MNVCWPKPAKEGDLAAPWLGHVIEDCAPLPPEPANQESPNEQAAIPRIFYAGRCNGNILGQYLIRSDLI